MFQASGGLEGVRQDRRTATKPVRRARNGHPGFCFGKNAPKLCLMTASSRNTGKARRTFWDHIDVQNPSDSDYPAQEVQINLGESSPEESALNRDRQESSRIHRPGTQKVLAGDVSGASNLVSKTESSARIDRSAVVHSITERGYLAMSVTYSTNPEACGVDYPDRSVAFAGPLPFLQQSANHSTVRTTLPHLYESGSEICREVANCRSKDAKSPLLEIPQLAIQPGSVECEPFARTHMRKDDVPSRTPARHTGHLTGESAAWPRHAGS